MNACIALMLVSLMGPVAKGDLIGDLVEKAGQGDVAAMLELAAHHEAGDATSRDMAVAVQWYTKAAEEGAAGAQMKLGSLYIGGRGVKKSSAEAARWFLLSAEQGNAAAQCQIGRMCLSGAGLPKDEVEAFKWSYLAAAQGDLAAKKLLAFLKQTLSPKQVEEGQRRALDFVALKPRLAPLEGTVEPVDPAELLIPVDP